jgi:hypothetical protein
MPTTLVIESLFVFKDIVKTKLEKLNQSTAGFNQALIL